MLSVRTHGRSLIRRLRQIGRPRLPRRAIRLKDYEPAPNGGPTYFLPRDYRERDAPEYYDDAPPTGIVYQPDVYRTASRLARRSEATQIVDIGCGNGEKLAALRSRFDVVGVDFGDNLVRCRARYPWGEWLEHDLESLGSLPVGADRLRQSVLVCADVVEHLRHPERTLSALREALDHAEGVIISTPDRKRLSGSSLQGPPGNPSHVREWARDEFAALIKSAGFTHGLVTYTRPHTGTLARSTVMAILVPARNKALLRRATWRSR